MHNMGESSGPEHDFDISRILVRVIEQTNNIFSESQLKVTQMAVEYSHRLTLLFQHYAQTRDNSLCLKILPLQFLRMSPVLKCRQQLRQ